MVREKSLGNLASEFFSEPARTAYPCVQDNGNQSNYRFVGRTAKVLVPLLQKEMVVLFRLRTCAS
jgi:hypothetical protein